MIVSLIAALDRRRGIGKDGRLPWRLPADLDYFKRITLGHAVVMGRRTHESIGRALPGRVNVVVSHTPHDSAAGVIWAVDLAEALLYLEHTGADEVFIIGGGEIYAQAMGRADRLYLTDIAAEVEADTWFPQFDPADWVETWRREHPADAENPFGMVFRRLERVKRNSA